MSATPNSNRMPYDHARKAGNRGDVWKHFTLIMVLDSVKVSARFRYVDLHCCAPVHELWPRGEWRHGVGRFLAECSTLKRHGYFKIASAFVAEGKYPAAWWFAAARLAERCQHVSLVLTDTADEVAKRYAPSPFPGLPTNVSLCFSQEDGFRRADNLTEGDLVLIDPPFSPDAAVDWKRIAKACRHLAARRIEFLAWYPIFAPTKPQHLVDATECSGWEATWAPFGPRPSQNLKGCGMLASPGVVGILNRTTDSLESLASCMGWNLSVRSPNGRKDR